VRTLEIADIAYASGYFDGEGTITTCGVGRGAVLRIQVLSADYWCVKVFSDLFGGNLAEIRPRPTVYARGLRVFRWIKTGQGVVETLRAMRPYLRCKRAEADVVIDSGIVFTRGLRMSEEQRSIRNAVRLQLKALKGVGRQAHYPTGIRIEGERKPGGSTHDRDIGPTEGSAKTSTITG
jgi:hypothetical protein